MNIKSFLKLVEIRTKVASVIPFIIGTLYTAYHFGRINVRNTAIFFASMILFDMTTTAINNYVDFKKAKKRSGYNFEKHNAMVSYSLNPNVVLIVIITMLVIASILGFLLFLYTDIVVLAIGIICFMTGILYSFGPVPISRTPAGEFFSGTIMGFFIIFLAIYINISDMKIIDMSLDGKFFNFKADIHELFFIFLLSVPCICGIANIMLANNICDMESDLADNRHTLPLYIGEKAALMVFAGLYCAAFISIIIMVVLQILPVVFLISLIAIVPVVRNVLKFHIEQTKKDTFSLSVSNFLIISGIFILVMIAVLSIGLIIGGIKIDLI